MLIITAIVLLVVNLVSATPPIVVRWSTASELDTAGFHIYRGENPDGPFNTKLNAELIPSSPDPLLGGTYAFTDTNVTPGHTYYYQLEDVDTNGVTNIAGTTHETAQGFEPGSLVIGIGVGLAAAVVIAWIMRKR